MTEQELKAIRERKNAYYREYRRKNRDKIRAINEKYWLKKINEEKEIEKATFD